MAINRSKNKRAGIVPPEECPITVSEATLDAVIAISEERAGYVTLIREALISGDDVQLKLYASKLCGLSADDIPRQPHAGLQRGLKHGKK